MDFNDYLEESETEEDEADYKLSRSASVPTLEKLEILLENKRLTKSENGDFESETDESKIKFNGETIDLTQSDLFSFSSKSGILA